MLLRWLCQLLSPFLFLFHRHTLHKRIQVIWKIKCSETLTIFTQGTLKMKLTSEQKVKVTIRPVTAGGNPARIDGAVTFASENEEVVRIEMIDDTTAEAIAVAPGTARITATFDADLDEDETRLLTFDAEIVVEEAEAVGGEVEFAAPEYLILTPIGEPEAHEETAVPATEDTEEAAPADEPTAVESESVVEDSSDVSDSAPPVEDAAVGDEPTAP